MKHINRIISYIFLIFIFTSCSAAGDNMLLFRENDGDLANATFEQLIDAIISNESAKIKFMFADSIQADAQLAEEAHDLIEFIQGKIISYSSASEQGTSAEYQFEHGKQKKEIQSAFTIKTTESKYYIAVKECVKDEFDPNNIGLLSIYIIEAENWNEDYIYRGDGKWSYGINIVGSIVD